MDKRNLRIILFFILSLNVLFTSLKFFFYREDSNPIIGFFTDSDSLTSSEYAMEFDKVAKTSQLNASEVLSKMYDICDAKPRFRDYNGRSLLKADRSVEVDAYKFLNDSIDDGAWVNQNTLFYDPRLTLSLYYSYLRAEIESNQMFNTEDFELPFHWSDWVNMTVFNDDLSNPIEKRKTCTWVVRKSEMNMRLGSRRSRCLDHTKFTEEHVEQFGLKRIEQLPGFTYTNYPFHRTFNDIRILQGRSYLYTSMESPNKILFLAGNEPPIEVKVNKFKKNGRVVDSGLMNRYLFDNSIKSKPSFPLKLRFDPATEFSKLRSTYATYSHHNSSEGLYDGGYELSLPDSSFSFNITNSIQALSEQEKKNSDEDPFQDALEMCSRTDGTNEPTYFQMSTMYTIQDPKNVDNDYGWHYDWRFFDGSLNYNRNGWDSNQKSQRTKVILERLLRNWFHFTNETKYISWIMHGPLLGWFWNGQTFPFDNDLDIQMPIDELVRLSKTHNRTLVVENPEEGYGKFLIDVGTYIFNRDISKTGNHIDARFIDVDSGIYIDITALSTSDAKIPQDYFSNGFFDDDVESKTIIINDRRKHFYSIDQITPLKKSMLNGVPVFVPNQISRRLNFEYSKGMVNKSYKGWYYVPQVRHWIHQDKIISAFNETYYSMSNKDTKKEDIILQILSEMDDNSTLTLLNPKNEIFEQFCSSANLTALHDEEWNLLFKFGTIFSGEDNSEKSTIEQIDIQDNKNVREKLEVMSKNLFVLRDPLHESFFEFGLHNTS